MCPTPKKVNCCPKEMQHLKNNSNLHGFQWDQGYFIPYKIGNYLLLMLVQCLSKSCVSLIGSFFCFCFINFVFARNSKVPIKNVFYLFIKNISVKNIFNDFVLPFKKLIFHIFTQAKHIHSFLSNFAGVPSLGGQIKFHIQNMT